MAGWRPIPLLLLLALLAGCNGVLHGALAPPEISIANVAFEELGLFEQALRVDLRLRNPNNAEIRARGLRFDLELEGQPFARGFTGEPFSVPRLGETVVPVRVSVPTAELFDRIMALGTTQRLDYRLTGDLLLAGLALREVPFTRDGVLSLPRPPGMPTS